MLKINNVCAYLFCVYTQPPQSVEASVYGKCSVENI